MNIEEINEEILYARDAVTKVDHKDIEFLKNRAVANRRKRIRLCLHKNTEAPLHEMLIILPRGAYARPHRHIQKSESFHVIEGNFKVVIFDERGDILEVVDMGNYSSGGKFYYRLSESYFHTVIPISEFSIYHETTDGPFRPEDTVFASWSPAEDEFEKQVLYINELTAQLSKRV